MKDFIKKIVNSFLAIVIAFGIILITYEATSYEADLLSASILDGLTEAEIASVTFVSPKGSAYPVNGVVTINSVFVDTVAATDGIVSGADLENSFITFSNSAPACVGAVFQGNKIILPETFNAACQVKIEISGVQKSPILADLTIEPVSCAALKTSILRGYGEGFENIVSADLGAFASTPSVNGFDFASITSSVDLNYPTTDEEDVEGAKTFQIHIVLVPDISLDPLNGISERAKIVANNGNGVYEIKVKNEGAANQVQTALNFAYIFNDLMGSDSPFVASPDLTTPTKILLQATEMGTHTNDGYVCIKDGTAVVAPCFTGGAVGQNEGLGVLTTPLKLDNEILQGESALVFAAHSSGEIQWITSHPSILEVTTLSEAAQQDAGTVDFVDTTVVPNGNATSLLGTYNITDCKKEYTGDPQVYTPNTETCTVTVKIPIDYTITGIGYTANVSIGDEIVPVTVQGSTLSGFLEGTGTYTSSGGLSVSLSGTVTGLVSGAISGTYSGTVTGQVSATVQTTGSKAGQDSELAVGDFTSGTKQFLIPPPPYTKGVLTDVPDSFTSTVKKTQDDVSHVAIIYAKRPGTSILSAMDKQGCIASFEIDVIEKLVKLQLVGRELGDVLDVSDTVQINAFVGGANSEIEEYENITAASGIEWFSSNAAVATIDSTGLLTALRPGVTNITARYDTGEAETGTIESVPMPITVNKISKLRVTFDKGTEDLLPAVIVNNAYKSVIIAIHNSEAAGQSFYIEGQQVKIELPAGTYTNNISKVAAITADLNTKITALNNSVPLPIIQVTTVDKYPGMLILQPMNQTLGVDSNSNGIEDIDENGIVDIDTTALEINVSILPTYNNAIPLPASETYGLMVIAQYDNGATKLIPPTHFSWVNTPVNYLEQASLDSGLIKMGEISGTSTVVASYENADGSVVNSNYLTITVDSGPVIEFVRRIGSGSVTKGSRIIMQTKISDVNTISDISSISTSIVYSNYSTYQQINEDSSAVWFSATPFLNEVTVVDQGTTGTTGTEEGTGTTTTSEPAPVALQYKTYNIPLEIPVNQNMFDGVYKLILSISDTSNHTLNYVYPIRIGEIGEGDVNGDGVTNMIDVILAFQIAAGISKTPTPAQLMAANVDGVGRVTLIDVILLFNKVTKKL